MAMFLSVIWSDLTSRAVSFLMERYHERCSRPTMEQRLHRLQKLLLRVRVIVEEAEERRITNQAMLLQLNMMRKEMYRGYYTLYTLKRRAEEEGDAKDHHQVSQSFCCICVEYVYTSRSHEQEQLQQVVACLETAIEGASEMVVLLSGCPRLYRQPYSMHLILDKCMFGRQVEMEHLVRFLLQSEIPGDKNRAILPIIGPRKVGKSTLVEHACNDERVREHFSQIVFLNGGNLTSENVEALGDAAVNTDFHGERVLLIVELGGDRFPRRLDSESIDEGLWQRLYSTYIRQIPRGSKIIVTSRMDKIASFGTTSPLRLRFIDQDAFWYFFKVRLFGSTDADEHPKVAAIAMDMAIELNGCFLTANIYSEVLRSNVDARFWSAALTNMKQVRQKNMLGGAHQVDIWEVTEPVYVPTLNMSEDFVILDDYEKRSALEHSTAVTTMTVQEVLLGTARPQGKFDVLAWRSPIPPHFSYFFGCEVRKKPRRTISMKKRILKTAN
ncbi:hypothetical protein EJB05_40793, partial [Eragrostis curvula]